MQLVWTWNEQHEHFELELSNNDYPFKLGMLVYVAGEKAYCFMTVNGIPIKLKAERIDQAKYEVVQELPSRFEVIADAIRGCWRNRFEVSIL